MNIDATQTGLLPDDLVLVTKPECTFGLELTTMRGAIRCVAGSVSLAVPNDRDALPQQPTLGDVVRLVLRRQHPVMQYVAERNGVRVIGYHERYTFSQQMSRIEYGPDGAAIRFYP